MAQGQVIVSINDEDMSGKGVQDVMEELHVRRARPPTRSIQACHGLICVAQLMCANVTPPPSCVAAACRSANDAHVEARVYGVAALSLPRPHAHPWREKEEEGQEEIVNRFIYPHREFLTHQSESESPDPYPDRPSRAAVAALPA